METIAITPLSEDYRKYIVEHIGIPVAINGLNLFYQKNACHVNSIIFSDFINNGNGELHCSVIEGIVINEDGLAYGHFWNKLNDSEGNIQYTDVTMDAIVSADEQALKKTYYIMSERNVDDLLNLIKTRDDLFSDKVTNAVSDYYDNHPDQRERFEGLKNTLSKGQTT